MDSVVQLQEVSSDLETALTDTEGTERELGRASRQMQTAIEQARMRMLSEILGRFPRLLRDLSVTHGKQVELVVRGSSTLVERSVLEILEDPLLHLIRNAFDHGIETPEARIAVGKPPKGKIEIAAGYRGNQTVITVSDDGNGINFAKLRDRALQMGLSESDLDGSNETEMLELIFEAGFSTADRVTELSGRGVGMDVVRRNVDAMGGVITVQEKNGGLFDSLVFGEKQAAHWVAGSDHFNRSELFEGPAESEAATRPVHVAVVYQADGTIRGYRDGQPYGRTYRKAPAAVFETDASQVLLGCRHGSPTGNKGLAGRIFRARLYDRALTPEDIVKTARIESTTITEVDILATLTNDQRTQLTRLQAQRDAMNQALEATRSTVAGTDPVLNAWASLAQSLINLKEFIYLR
jgi:hypothetical protein